MNVNIKLIRESYAALKPHIDEVIEHFVEESFTRLPGSAEFFASANTREHRVALAGSLSYVVKHWEDTKHLGAYLERLGEQYAGKLPAIEHFDLVAEAVLATFRYYFEKQWTADHNACWSQVLSFIQDCLIRGMTNAYDCGNIQTHQIRELSLEESARKLAREAFRKALDDECTSGLQELAHEKARELLRKALDSEARDLMNRLLRKVA